MGRDQRNEMSVDMITAT